MKNYMDQLKMAVVVGTDDYSQTTINGFTSESELQIKKNKLYDTSSSATAFSGFTADDVVKMSGWDQDENNGIFTVVEVESSGEWITFDSPLIDVLEADVPSSGIDLIDTPVSMSVTGVTENGAKILYGVNIGDPSATGTAGPSDMKVTADDTVSSFADFDQSTPTDAILVFWADLSEG